MVTRATHVAAIGLVTLAACGPSSCVHAFETPSPDAPKCNPTADRGTIKPKALMGLTSARAFAAPYPALGRRDGLPANTSLAWRLKNLIHEEDGYAISAAIFFPLDRALLPFTPLPREFERPDPKTASVLVFPLDLPNEPAAVNVEPLEWHWADETDSGVPFKTTSTLLSVIPVQGRPLLENKDYVAFVRSSVATPDGAMTELCDARTTGAPVAGVGDQAKYAKAIAQVESLGVPCGDLAAITVFHTGDPTAKLHTVQRLARADWTAAKGDCAPIHLARERAGPEGWRCADQRYCVYTGEVRLPQYQRGTPPHMAYLEEGGGWPDAPIPARADVPGCSEDWPPGAAGQPWTPSWRTARVVVTIPHAPPPEGRRKYPTLALVRTGAGTHGDTLVDRGPLVGAGCAAAACRGPAEVLQSVGFAGISVDGPLVGLSRNEPLELDEDLGVFNFLNPEALRDNIRQSAIELGLLPRILDEIELDLGECEGAGTGTLRVLDRGHLALFAHSMGATVAPLALADTPDYHAAILSGSGGSLIENVLFKKKPVPILAASSLLGYACAPERRDPSMSLMQWALEASDAQVYARRIALDEEGGDTWWSPNARHVLMIQGVIDNYIAAPIANVTTLGARLDLAVGPGSCAGDRRCDSVPFAGISPTPPGYPSLVDLLPLSGRADWPLAQASGRVAVPSSTPRPDGFPDRLTAVVVQHRIDENRESSCAVDGHEVIYESKLARHQYACFLDDFAHDRVPAIRAAGEALAPCTP